ncbi:MAG TPA: DUF4124 domain-containing protein [Smithella sp.]|nr:DUF4124 domain-containing protein [Smithella sp.]
MRRIFLISCIVFSFIISANAGETYKCIDNNGNTVFTDAPQDGMQCKSQNGNNIESSQEDQTQGESNQKAQPEENMKAKLLSMAAVLDCYVKYLQNMDQKCLEHVRNKIFQKLSHHCQELRNAGQLKELYKDCDNEMESAYRQIDQEANKCNKLPANSKCRKKVEARDKIAQEYNFECKKKLRKAGICMTGEPLDYGCITKHGAEIRNLCGDINKLLEMK